MGQFAIMVYISIKVVYSLLPINIYGSCQVFEKKSRFLIGWALQRGGQGPGKGPNSSLQHFDYIWIMVLARCSRKKKSIFPLVGCYREMIMALARAHILCSAICI